MPNKHWIVVIFFSLLLFILSGCRETNEIVHESDVKNVTICFGCKEAIILNPTIPKEKTIIQKLVTWIDGSKVVKQEIKQPTLTGGIQLNLNNGSNIMIQDAVETVCVKSPNGSDCHGEEIKNQVTIFQNNNEPFRIISSELQSWVNGKWKEDIQSLKQ